MFRNLCFGVLLFVTWSVNAQDIKISEIQGENASSPYNNQVVSTKGAVTGVYRDGYFIRDNNGPWGGIYVYDPARNPKPRTGDTISLTGTVTEYYEWTELKTITKFEILSTGNPKPEPVILSADEIDESWESCFVRIENAICTNTDLGFGEWEIYDGSASFVVDDMGVVFKPELGQKYSITGNIIFSFEFFKIEPASLEDIEILASIYISKEPVPDSISKNEITLSWETNVESISGLKYGLSPDLELGMFQSGNTGISHNLKIEGLEPASIIYVQAFAILGNDTARSKVSLFITASESSGKINVSFNRTNTDYHFSDSPELFTDHLADTFVYYISKAKKTLDLALYDFTTHSTLIKNYNSGIYSAIYQAVADGVQVRLITDAAVADAAPVGQELPIPRLDVDHEGIMHHKFIIVDHESVDNSWLITGSTNPNYNNMVLDFNNLVAIQDQSLAKAYLMEFEEIWGGTGPDPVPAASKSGNKKTDNTPHYFHIAGKNVELYFSPSDHTTSQIVDKINSSGSEIDFALMAFTENSLGNAVIDAKSKGKSIKGIIDYVEYSGSEFVPLLNAGIDVLDYKNPNDSTWPNGNTLHHKFAVLDADTDNAAVITGSHNWTASAESINDENTLIFYDKKIAGLYKQEVERIRTWLMNPPVRPDAIDDYAELYTENPLILDVLKNDNITGDLELEVISQPKYGTADISENLSILYFPGEVFTNSNDTLTYRIYLTAYPAFFDTAIAIVHKVPDAVSEINNPYKIRIYPNPVGNFINIYLTGETLIPESVEILNATGQTLYKENKIYPAYPCRINCSKLEAGIYFVVVKTNLGEIRRKVIKN